MVYNYIMQWPLHCEIREEPIHLKRTSQSILLICNIRDMFMIILYINIVYDYIIYLYTIILILIMIIIRKVVMRIISYSNLHG